MNYKDLKPIFADKTFKILANLTDNPTCGLYLPNFDNVNSGTFDPFDQTSVDSTNITKGENIYINTVPCIYTYDKLFVQETEVVLGSKYTLIIYIRADDLPVQIKENLGLTIIKFNDIFYKLSSHLNLYNILYEFTLQ